MVNQGATQTLVSDTPAGTPRPSMPEPLFIDCSFLDNEDLFGAPVSPADPSVPAESRQLTPAFGYNFPDNADEDNTGDTDNEYSDDFDVDGLEDDASLSGRYGPTASSPVKDHADSRTRRDTRSHSMPERFKSPSSMPMYDSGASRNLSAASTRMLKEWMLSPEHYEHPYPNEREKHELAAKAGISPKQLMIWFTNARKRVWAPMRRRQVRCVFDFVTAVRLPC
jgi:hypothetical protein